MEATQLESQYISLDILDNKTYQYLYSKQYDEGRDIVFEITQNGLPLDLTGMIATFQMKKPDNTVVINDCTISDNKISISITNQMTICFGRIPFQVQLIKDETVITTVTGFLNVSESVVHPDDVISSDEFNALTHALIKVEKLNVEITNAEALRQSNEEVRKSNENTRISNEILRQSEEEIRKANEIARTNAENIRCQNEETRQSKENIRESNEESRQNDTADAIAKSNTATTKCIKVTEDLQEKLDEHYFVLGSDKGVSNGVAELDENGHVPSSQLPGYVDDVIEGYFNEGVFYEDIDHNNIIVCESGKIYVDLNTNKTYRWSGTSFIVISDTIVLGETSSTAYRGDRGKTAYEHSLGKHARVDATNTEESNINGNIQINGEETVVYTHPKSGASVGSYGDISDQSPVAGGSFKVPYLSVDDTGHIQEINEHTVTLPVTSVVVDEELSTTSTNPVQNSVITEAIENKQDKITGAASTVTSKNLTASRVLVSNSSGKVSASSITSTKLGYLSDVTDNIQAQINNKNSLQTIDGHLIQFSFVGTVLKIYIDGILAESFTQFRHFDSSITPPKES